jgi:hypothetical protein
MGLCVKGQGLQTAPRTRTVPGQRINTLRTGPRTATVHERTMTTKTGTVPWTRTVPGTESTLRTGTVPERTMTTKTGTVPWTRTVPGTESTLRTGPRTGAIPRSEECTEERGCIRGSQRDDFYLG